MNAESMDTAKALIVSVIILQNEYKLTVFLLRNLR